MSRDYGQMEQAFLAGLEADTGRDLAGWMAAIEGLGPLPRNDIIDWLRRQRFTFARASWLERIHHNGGRPIYATAAPGAGGERPRRRGRSAEQPAPPAAPLPAPAEAPPPAAPAAPLPSAPPEAAPAMPPAGTAEALAALVARAKGYQPLYRLLEARLAQAVPGVAMVADGDVVSLRSPLEFGIIEVNAKGLRLGLALAEASPAGFQAVSVHRKQCEITRQLALNDARQITPELLAAAAAAARTGAS